jgi:hypothetical protein
MKKSVTKFGLIGAGIMAVLALIPIMFNSGEPDFKWGQVIGYASMIIALSTVFLGIKSYRDNHQAGIISFGKAFQVGFLISLFACAIYVIVWMIYLTTDSGMEMMDKYMAFSIEQMETQGASATELQAHRDKMESFNEMYKNPLVRIGFTLLEILPVSLIITLISSLILKRGK